MIVIEIFQIWDSFYSEWHIEKLWLNWKKIYAVYFNYEKDYNWNFDILNWEYDLIIWWKSMANWYDKVNIFEWNYKEFITKWEMPEKVINWWKQIWNDNTLNREFKTDYEIYDYSWDINNPNVSIFIWNK